MNFKPAIFLLLIVFTASFFSACSKAESESSEEVVFENQTTNAAGDVVITNADIKLENQTAQPETSQPASELAKRLLPDKSEIVTLLDGYGTKTETRYFPGNTRIRYVTLRTGADGSHEVTVYSTDGRAKIVTGLGEDAMTASSDQIAGAAQITSTGSSPILRNYMKRRPAETQTPLQPLPSSAFQQPTVQYPQPVPAEPQTSAESQQNPEQPQQTQPQPESNPEEN